MRGLADGLDPSSAYLTPDRSPDAGRHTRRWPSGDVGVIVTRQMLSADRSACATARRRRGRPAHAATSSGTSTPSRRATCRPEPARGCCAAPPGKVTLTVILRNDPADPHVVDLVREPSARTRLVDAASACRAARPTSGSPASPTARPPACGSTSTACGTQAATRRRHRPARHGRRHDRTSIAAARLLRRDGHARDARRTRPTRDGRRRRRRATARITLPVVLLISHGTANAAEVFAAALAGNHRADLVGEPTAGRRGTASGPATRRARTVADLRALPDDRRQTDPRARPGARPSRRRTERRVRRGPARRRRHAREGRRASAVEESRVARFHLLDML